MGVIEDSFFVLVGDRAVCGGEGGTFERGCVGGAHTTLGTLTPRRELQVLIDKGDGTVACWNVDR